MQAESYIYTCVIWRIEVFAICCIPEILNFYLPLGQKCSQVAMLNTSPDYACNSLFESKQLLLICQVRRSLFFFCLPKSLLALVPKETSVWLEERWGLFPTCLMYLPLFFAFSICRALLLQVPVVNSDLLMIGLLFSYLSWMPLTLSIDLQTWLEIYWLNRELGVPPVIIL